MKLGNELRIDVTKVRVDPCSAEPRCIIGETDDAAEHREAEWERDTPARELGDGGVIERCDDDVRPGGNLAEEHILPLAALHLEDHHRAAGECAESADPLEVRVAREILRRERLDRAIAELVVVKKDGGVVGKQPQIRLEAVGAGPKRFLE